MAFNPPEALVLFAPLAKLSWKSASWAWLSVQTSLTLGLACLAWTFGGNGRPRWLGPALASVFLLNPLTYRLLALGQCTLLVASVIALGQWAFEARRPIFGSILWGFAGIKPQIAIPFLALAFVLGGWRRFAGVAVIIGALNLIGCLITTGTPHTLFEYVQFVTENHLIGLNRVGLDQITSWNRVLYVLGGPSLDLTAKGMITSHACWILLLWLRHGRPVTSTWVPAYALAAAAVGSVFCSLSHGYDLVMLALLAPLMIARFKLGQRGGCLARRTHCNDDDSSRGCSDGSRSPRPAAGSRPVGFVLSVVHRGDPGGLPGRARTERITTLDVSRIVTRDRQRLAAPGRVGPVRLPQQATP